MFMHILTLVCLMASVASYFFLAFLALSIVFILGRAIYRKNLSYETFTDTATVISAEFQDNALFTPDYYVYVKYQGKEFCIEDEELYAEAIARNDVKVLVHKGYNGANKVCAMYLTAA